MGAEDSVWMALTTVASEADANSLATQLVTDGHVACVSIVPAVQSIYRWKGALERAQEWMLVIKLAQSQLLELRMKWGDLHPYDVPELLMFRVEDGHLPYLNWVRASAKPESAL